METVTEDTIRYALKQVIDSELFVNIIDLGLVYMIEVEQGNVKVEMTVTSPTCPAGPQLMKYSREAINGIDGVCDVEIKLVMDPPWTQDKMTEDAKDQLGIF